MTKVEELFIGDILANPKFTWEPDTRRFCFYPHDKYDENDEKLIPEIDGFGMVSGAATWAAPISSLQYIRGGYKLLYSAEALGYWIVDMSNACLFTGTKDE